VTKIAFWNVQRLGAGTDDARKKVLTELATFWKPDLNLYCELTTGSTVPAAQNMTYRKESASQLCYGAVTGAGAHVGLTKYTPLVDAGYKNAGYKGGNDFTQLADRAVAFAGNIGGADIYVIHAPAATGIKAMAFIAASMNAHYGGTAWLVVGDFNVIPSVLGAAPVGIDVSSLVRNSGLPTKYYEATKKWSEYDYALANFPVAVKAMRATRWTDYSDHGPILLEY
jgi:hypothetical protein